MSYFPFHFYRLVFNTGGVDCTFLQSGVGKSALVDPDVKMSACDETWLEDWLDGSFIVICSAAARDNADAGTLMACYSLGADTTEEPTDEALQRRQEGEPQVGYVDILLGCSLGRRFLAIAATTLTAFGREDGEKMLFEALKNYQLTDGLKEQHVNKILNLFIESVTEGQDADTATDDSGTLKQNPWRSFQNGRDLRVLTSFANDEELNFKYKWPAQNDGDVVNIEIQGRLTDFIAIFP